MPTNLYISPWDYEITYFQLVHNLATDRYGWMDETTGQIEAWYVDKETALLSRHPGEKPTLAKANLV